MFFLFFLVVERLIIKLINGGIVLQILISLFFFLHLIWNFFVCCRIYIFFFYFEGEKGLRKSVERKNMG